MENLHLENMVYKIGPSEYRIEEMIKKYLALKIAYPKFKEVYDLVKDDYANGDDDEIPF